jgi:hypothetical protein
LSTFKLRGVIKHGRIFAMQKRHALRDGQWDKNKDALPGKPEDPGRTCKGISSN